MKVNKATESFLQNKSVDKSSMSLHAIMLQKGSKCKCNNDPDIFSKSQEDMQDIPSGKYCSSFCKKIGPKDQKKIILECLRIENNNLNEGKVVLNT